MSVLHTCLRGLGAVLLLLALLFIPMELDIVNGGAENGIPSVPEYLMRQMRYVILTDGRLETEMFADEAEFRMEQQQLKAKKVHGDFYNEQAEITKIQGEQAIYSMQKHLLHLTDNVVCETPDHFFLRSPSADYDLNKKYFSASGNVDGNTKDLSLKFWSDRADSYVNTRTANLYGNARADFQSAKQKELTKIRGDRALVDRGEEAVTFFDNVKIHQDKYDVESKAASLFYSGAAKAVQYMVAREDVKIKEAGGRYTRSQEAQFFSPTNTIVLLGFPSVYDKSDVVTGDRITMYRNTGVIEVTSANAAVSDDAPATHKKSSKKDEELSDEDRELIP